MMSFKQIAEEMGISESRVRQIYSRAIRKIRNRLTPEMEEAIIPLLKDEPEPDETLFDMYVRKLLENNVGYGIDEDE